MASASTSANPAAAFDGVERDASAAPAANSAVQESTTGSSSSSQHEKPQRNHELDDSIPAAASPSAPYAIASGPSITETTLVPPPPPPRQGDSSTSPLTTIESQSIPILPTSPPTTTSLSITLLLLSSVRYPFVINSEYLTRHNVTLPDHDPMQMTVSALKECIWKEWRDDWDTKPPSANFIRLIHFGQLLSDRQLLKDCRLNPDTPNVVHMNARPAELGDDDTTQRSAAKLGFSRGNRERSESGASPTCRCVIL
ncbi:ubiquitin-related domain-containing protein [Peziza echinospora]|nr:ubiquitin-related domain-containing protein [Peziza echinospora]